MVFIVAPDWAKALFRHSTPDTISHEELIRQMNHALRLPGLAAGWTMPIKGRIEMLSTGLRTPVGLKISGADLAAIEQIGVQVEGLLPGVQGTRSVFAERTGSGSFLDFEWDRVELARYGLSMEEVQDVVAKAIGCETVTTTIEGRERYSVNVRYMRDFREDIGALGRVLVTTSAGQRRVPLADLADIRIKTGPSMIRNDDGRSPATSTWTSRSATRRVTSTKPRTCSVKESSCRPAMRSPGAASTKACSARTNGSRWWCR